MAERTALYRLFGEKSLLYVGVTSEPLRRWTRHAEDKAWWPEVSKLTLEWFPNRDAALAAEIAAILDEHPLHNSPGWKLTKEPGKTPNRIIRVDDQLWEDFGRLCVEEGTDRAKDIRAYMQRRVRRWKRLQSKRPDPAADDE